MSEQTDRGESLHYDGDQISTLNNQIQIVMYLLWFDNMQLARERIKTVFQDERLVGKNNKDNRRVRFLNWYNSFIQEVETDRNSNCGRVVMIMGEVLEELSN